MAKILSIDETECIACESCVELCPDAFAMSDVGEYAVVTDPQSKAECVEDAITTCPVECITWEDG